MGRGLPALGITTTLLCGCASALPSMAGGSAVPEGRGDVIIGGSARVPVGQQSVPASDDGAGSSFGRAAGGGGIVPVGVVRWGLAERWDLGLTVAGTEARLGVRHERVLEQAVTRPSVLLGAAVTGGWIDDPGGGDGWGWRLGGELPLLYAVEFGGVYDLWLGGRVGAEHVRGDFTLGTSTAAVEATALRAGPVLGLAAGFRRLHVLLELTTYYEGWLGDHRSLGIDDTGWVLVPSFGIRLRL